MSPFSFSPEEQDRPFFPATATDTATDNDPVGTLITAENDRAKADADLSAAQQAADDADKAKTDADGQVLAAGLAFMASPTLPNLLLLAAELGNDAQKQKDVVDARKKLDDANKADLAANVQAAKLEQQFLDAVAQNNANSGNGSGNNGSGDNGSGNGSDGSGNSGSGGNGSNNGGDSGGAQAALAPTAMGALPTVPRLVVTPTPAPVLLPFRELRRCPLVRLLRKSPVRHPQPMGATRTRSAIRPRTSSRTSAISRSPTTWAEL